MPGLILDTFNRLRYKLPARPRQVQLEVTNRCNLDCHMCPREVMGIELEHMEWNTFTALMDRLTHREEITLTGWGEPFLHPRIFDMIAYCRERGHIVKITSNGLFPKPDMVERILASGLESLTFYIDSVEARLAEGHTSLKAIQNMEAVARGRRGGRPYLRLQATLHAGGEGDLYDVIRFGARLGFDAVNVGRIDRKYDAGLKRPGLREEARVFRRADQLARQTGIQLDWLQYAVSTGLVRWAYRLLRGKLHRSGQYCLKTFDYTYVNRKGEVTPCCLLPKDRMGNLLEENLQSIWQGSRYWRFRENYRETCGTCDLWTVAMVDESPEATLSQSPPTGSNTP